MAITILDTPATYSSMHDDLWFTSSSTNSGTTNFKFVYDVKVNGNLVARSKVFPDIVGSYGVFNAAPIVRAYSSQYFEPSGSSILVESNDKLKVIYKVEIGEEVSGVVTTNMASGEYSGYNYYQPLFADMFKTSAITLSTYYDALLSTNFSDNFLTERDGDEIKATYGENFFVSYWKKTGGTYIAKVDVINEDQTIATSVSANITLTGEFNMFNLKAANVNAWAGSTIITENTYAYDFYLVLSSVSSRKIRISQDCNGKFTPYNIHFLNRVGGWDTFKFGLVNKRNSEVQKSSYKKSEWQLTGSSMSNSDAYNKFNESNVDYNIKHTNRYHLVADYINEQNYEWLGQLIASPSVYMEVQGAYFPVSVRNNNYDYKKLISDKLFNLEIDVEINKNINSQFR